MHVAYTIFFKFMHKGSKDVSYISLLGGVKLLWYVYTCNWHLKVVSFQRDMLRQNECMSHLWDVSHH